MAMGCWVPSAEPPEVAQALSEIERMKAVVTTACSLLRAVKTGLAVLNEHDGGQHEAAEVASRSPWRLLGVWLAVENGEATGYPSPPQSTNRKKDLLSVLLRSPCLAILRIAARSCSA
jgi:hypothetical protein